MRLKLTPQSATELRTERESQLKSFIVTSLAVIETDRPDGLLVIARSPESAVFRAVFALADELGARRIGTRVVLMPGTEGEKWSLDFPPAFLHETRLAVDHRVLDAHEQLVVGNRATWFGDSMRREPDKRDAFQQFTADDIEIARRARATFASLWAGCAPLYRNEVAPLAASPALATAAGDAALAQDVLDTLTVWRPSSSH
jgi:hypothetical protein